MHNSLSPKGTNILRNYQNAERSSPRRIKDKVKKVQKIIELEKQSKESTSTIGQ